MDEEPVVYDDYNSHIRDDQSTIGTITSTIGNSALRNSYKIIEKDNNKIMQVGNYMPSNHDASRVVDTNGIAPCVKENHGTVTGILE